MTYIARGLLAVTLLSAASLAQANITNTHFIDVANSSSFDGWNNLARPLTEAAIISGYGSNVAGSGDAVFTRTSGNAYPAGEGLYQFLTSTFTITDNTLISGLNSLVFQSYSQQGFPNDDFWNPQPISNVTLSLNGGSQSLVATSFSLSADGGFDNTIGYFTWDLSGVAEPITSYSISFTTYAHASTRAFQIDQIAAVPEPSEYALLLGGLALVGFAARRKQNTQA